MSASDVASAANPVNVAVNVNVSARGGEIEFVFRFSRYTRTLATIRYIGLGHGRGRGHVLATFAVSDAVTKPEYVFQPDYLTKESPASSTHTP